MPPTVGLFINPGVVPAASEQALPRFNRSFEYDDVSDRYTRFLIEEMIPFVESRHGVKISSDPNDRGICGASSGGVCAFVVAWNRPDAFRRVYSMIGTFVGLRGGDELATLVRKTEPKPLRVFLQDGTRDLNIYGGDWWLENQTMERALQWAGYEVEHVWGEDGHNHNHGAAIFPQAIAGCGRITPAGSDASGPVVEPGPRDAGGWCRLGTVGDGYQWAEGLAVTSDGTLYFSDVPASKIYRVLPAANRKSSWRTQGRPTDWHWGRTAACTEPAAAQKILAWDLQTRASEVIAEGFASNDLVVLHDGSIDVTDPEGKRIWHIDPAKRESKPVDTFDGCNGITVSPDQTLLYVAHFPGRFIFSYQIAADGSLYHKQPYFHLHLPPVGTESHADGMCTSVEGWLLSLQKVASRSAIKRAASI